MREDFFTLLLRVRIAVRQRLIAVRNAIAGHGVMREGHDREPLASGVRSQNTRGLLGSRSAVTPPLVVKGSNGQVPLKKIVPPREPRVVLLFHGTAYSVTAKCPRSQTASGRTRDRQPHAGTSAPHSLSCAAIENAPQ